MVNNINKIPKYIRINTHAIKLLGGQQPLHKPIYSLKLVELEALKAYIKIYLANSFIIASKSPIDTPIFFNWMLNQYFWLFINY